MLLAARGTPINKTLMPSPPGVHSQTWKNYFRQIMVGVAYYTQIVAWGVWVLIHIKCCKGEDSHESHLIQAKAREKANTDSFILNPGLFPLC